MSKEEINGIMRFIQNINPDFKHPKRQETLATMISSSKLTAAEILTIMTLPNAHLGVDE